jgi:hypothetical protein
MAGMTYAEAARIKAGDIVTIIYLGKPEQVEVVSTIHADRWSEQMIVEFASGATVAVSYKTMEAGFISEAARHANSILNAIL